MISIVSIGLKLTKKKKNSATPFNPVFFMLIVKSFETLPKHTELSFISKFFVLNWYSFVALTNKKLLLSS